MRASLALVVLLLLVGCRGDAATQRELIVLRDGCMGTCPVYTLSVASNGQVVFDGQQFTVRQGPVSWRVDPDTARALLDEYTHLRDAFLQRQPAGPPDCPVGAVTEGRPRILLREAAGVDSLSRYTDCAERGSDYYGAFAARIDRALGALPYVEQKP